MKQVTVVVVVFSRLFVIHAVCPEKLEKINKDN